VQVIIRWYGRRSRRVVEATMRGPAVPLLHLLAGDGRPTLRSPSRRYARKTPRLGVFNRDVQRGGFGVWFLEQTDFLASTSSWEGQAAVATARRVPPHRGILRAPNPLSRPWSAHVEAFDQGCGQDTGRTGQSFGRVDNRNGIA
jgi:hypothetical protein